MNSVVNKKLRRLGEELGLEILHLIHHLPKFRMKHLMSKSIVSGLQMKRLPWLFRHMIWYVKSPSFLVLFTAYCLFCILSSLTKIGNGDCYAILAIILSILLLPNFMFMYLWFFFPRYYFIRLNHKYEDAASLFLYKLSRMDCSQRNFLYKVILCMCLHAHFKDEAMHALMHIFLKMGHAFDVNSVLGLIFHVICIILDLCFL